MPSFILAISGPTAAGKTYFTNHLREYVESTGLSTVTLSTDEFYHDLTHLSMKQRIEVNFDQPKSIDHEEFFRVLEDLSVGKICEVPIYDFSTHTRTGDFRRVEPADLIIVEGIFSLSFEKINAIYDLKVYIDLDQDLRLIRRVRRDMRERGRSLESVFTQYLDQVRPSQSHHVGQDRNLADLILFGNKPHQTIIELITAGINHRLE